MTLCDIGNSTFHFKQGKKDFKISVDKNIKHLPTIKGKIYYTSVNNKGTKKLLKKYPDALNIETIVKFKTKYQGMGIDRKIVCSYIQNGIIIDVGSAITVDIMDNGKHKGGIIIPGFNAYKKIYPQISKKLSFIFKNDINLDKIPLNTQDAINYPIIGSIVSQIKSIHEKYEKTIYFTGEDSKVLLKYFKNIDIKYKKNLIFNSMKSIIKQKENRC
ncbi:MAG: type III pantothenate kinase [Campylobacterota bacterium]|nr:type III pantothenate kinase [Campylobacterota bacterium]